MSKPDGKTILDQNEVATNYDSLYYIGYFVILLGFVPSVIYYLEMIDYNRITASGILPMFGVHYWSGKYVGALYYPILIILLMLFYRNFNVAEIDRKLYFMIALLMVLLIYNMLVPYIGQSLSGSY